MLIPEQRYNENRRIEEANIVIQWQRQRHRRYTKNQLIAATSTTRAQFTEEVYIGVISTKNRSYEGEALKQERAFLMFVKIWLRQRNR